MTTEELELRYFTHKLNVPKHTKLGQPKTKAPEVVTDSLPDYVSWLDEKKYTNLNVD